MQPIDHGIFSPYAPKLAKDHKFFGQPQVQFLKNEADLDWYDLVGKPRDKRRWLAVFSIEGALEAQAQDASTLFPSGRRVVEAGKKLDERALWSGTDLVMPLAAPLAGAEIAGELQFKAEPNNVYAAFHNGERVAQLEVWPDLKTGKPCSYRMQTDPAYGRRGVMSALVRWTEGQIGEPLVISSQRSLDGARWRDKFDAQKGK